MYRANLHALGCLVVGFVTVWIGRDPTIWFASVVIISALAR